jgi:hypothetical protein
LAFAVRHHGRLLLHTLRASEDEAREAAVRGIEQSRARWPELQRRGYAVVRVRIQAESIRWDHPRGGGCSACGNDLVMVPGVD